MSTSSNLRPNGDGALPAASVTSLARLHSRAVGIASGLLLAVALFGATIFLVIRGGEHVGAHLGLLSVFFPGYSVSMSGAFIGFVYAFVVGYALGRIVGAVYNRVVRPS